MKIISKLQNLANIAKMGLSATQYQYPMEIIGQMWKLANIVKMGLREDQQQYPMKIIREFWKPANIAKMSPSASQITKLRRIKPSRRTKFCNGASYAAWGNGLPWVWMTICTSHGCFKWWIWGSALPRTRGQIESCWLWLQNIYTSRAQLSLTLREIRILDPKEGNYWQIQRLLILCPIFHRHHRQ